MIALWLGALGCAPGPLALEAVAGPAGVQVTASRPLDRIELRDGAGAPIVRRALPGGAHTVALAATLAPGETVRVIAGAGGATAALALAVGETVAAPPPARVAGPGDLAVAGGAFPTDAFGVPEPARTPDRVELPGTWAVWAGRGLGWRARPDQAPWAWSRVDLVSSADVPLDLAVSQRILDSTGSPAPAFRAHLREPPQDEVAAVLRLPAGREAAVALPVYVEGARVAPGLYTRELTVRAMTGGPVLAVARAPLAVRRSGPILAAGVAFAAAGVLGGWALLLLRGRAWFAALGPSEALVIGLLGALGHLAGAVVQLVGAGLAAVLGPFAPFLTGLADDALRACLLASLLALVPRAGAAAFAAVVGTAVRAVVLGAFHPLDLLAIGATVAWLEGAVWAAGAARPGWPDRPLAWWRLGAALVVANVALTATSLVFGAVGWRMYYSGAYVLCLLALPGALYAALGCALAVPFASSLRRVAP